MQHTSPPLDVKISQLVSYPHRICAVSFTLQSTSSGDRVSSSSFTTPYPGHPAAPGFKRRSSVSWCLFALCVKYRYGKSPRGETHKALTVSYWVLVPITHLRGLFSCQLPRRNSQLHDFWKRFWGEQVLTDSPNSHSVCQQNTRDLQLRWRQKKKKKLNRIELNWIKLTNSGTDTNILDVVGYQCSDNRIQATWACFAAVERACIIHALSSSCQIFCQSTNRTYFNFAQKTMQGAPSISFFSRTNSFNMY